MKIIIFLIFANAVLYTKTDNICNIKISNSKMSIFRDSEKLIYNDGKIDQTWTDNTSTPYVATSDEDIQYFYIMENKLTNSNNKDNIVLIIKIEYNNKLY
jgi:hypothetical protein